MEWSKIELCQLALKLIPKLGLQGCWSKLVKWRFVWITRLIKLIENQILLVSARIDTILYQFEWKWTRLVNTRIDTLAVSIRLKDELDWLLFELIHKLYQFGWKNELVRLTFKSIRELCQFGWEVNWIDLLLNWYTGCINSVEIWSILTDAQIDTRVVSIRIRS